MSEHIGPMDPAVADALRVDMEARATSALETVHHFKMERQHLDALRTTAGRLYAIGLSDDAHEIMAVVRYAEAIDAFTKKPAVGEPYVHMLPRSSDLAGEVAAGTASWTPRCSVCSSTEVVAVESFAATGFKPGRCDGDLSCAVHASEGAKRFTTEKKEKGP
jgi:hypothetical protein